MKQANFKAGRWKADFRRAVLCGLGVLSLSLALSAPAFAVENLLGNAGFEAALGGANNWDNTANRGITTVAVGAPEGTTFLQLDEATTVGLGFSGVFTFQVVTGIQPGESVTFSGLVRLNSQDAAEAAQLRIEFQDSGGNLIDGNSIAAVSTISGSFARVSTTGVAPEGTTQAAFVIRIEPSGAAGTAQADFDDMHATKESAPILLEAGSANSVVGIGDLTAIAVNVRNTTLDTLTNLELIASPPPGINIHRKEAAFEGRPVSQRAGSVIFELGTLAPGQSQVLTFVAVLTSAVQPNTSYEIELLARADFGLSSRTVRILIRVEADPVFQQGTIIGKVFNDLNRSGFQEKGEIGLGGVRLATEEGIVVITDADGQYHIPAVAPGRHLVKIDAHTLPEGTEFITEETYLVRTTEGLMNKANFAVLVPPSKIPDEFSEALSVNITQGLDMSRPELDVTMNPSVLRMGFEVLEAEPSFQFHINYPDFVKNWFLEIRDHAGREIWTGFGVAEPPARVIWSGQTEAGFLVKPGIYSYQFKVEDKDGHQDWTVLKFFRVISKTAPKEQAALLAEIPSVGDFNIFADGKRSIPLVAKPTLHVIGKTGPDYRVTVNGYPVNVDGQSGNFETEMYVRPGEKEIAVTATSPEGENTTYRETVGIRDSTFFMVALGEQELGVNFQDGDVQTAANEDRFKSGFYEDGRLAYYLRGKIRGKFLVKSHYDTGDKRSALFTNLDPDDYYPVYGDDSVRDYEAQDTLDRFFLIVEMDRSFAKWGSFETNFNDTELASYNRTLNGMKVHFETLRANDYGDPKQELDVFWSEASHKADHNEFAATGGSLYYLRNREVIEGSEKIRVEVRDKIQDIAVGSYDLIEGQDYEIDYAEGRILLSRPLSSVAASDTLVSSSILDGNPVYLIVDYEYNAGASAFTDGNRGIRGTTYMGNHLRVGATVIEERRREGDYDLRAVDAQMKFGRNTKITAEYAETNRQAVAQAVSFNGGLSFANLETLQGTNTRGRENAYLIKGESRPFDNLEVSGFIQGVEPSFSTDRIRSQEGTKKYGMAARYKLHDYVTLRYRFDHQEVADQLLPLSEHGIFAPYETVRSHTVQAAYDDGKHFGELEYRRQDYVLPQENLAPSLLSEIPFKNGIAGKLGYRLNERLIPYVRFQVTTDEKDNNQFGGGLRYEINDYVSAYFEQLIGNIGDSVLFGFERNHGDGAKSYVNIRSVDRGIGSRVLNTTVGSSFALTENSRIYSERYHSTFRGYENFADAVGMEGRITDKWSVGAKFERSHLKNSVSRLLDRQAQNSLARSNAYNTVAGSLSYDDRERLKFRTYLEGRRDQDTPEIWQWVTRNLIEYKMNQDLTFLGKLDFGKSRFTSPEDTPADFMEFDTGFAYRPVDHDKLNVLARYTYLRNKGNDLQFQSPLFAGIETDEQAHILAIDLAYDLHRYLSVVEKVAYKNAIVNPSVTGDVILHNFLWAHRFNFHVTRKWDLALEYRMLWQSDAAKTLKQGAMVQVDREFYDYVRLGVGYNFTDFDDDLRETSDYDTHGPFVRLTGKF